MNWCTKHDRAMTDRCRLCDQDDAADAVRRAERNLAAVIEMNRESRRDAEMALAEARLLQRMAGAFL